jgi:hypothetical protein
MPYLTTVTVSLGGAEAALTAARWKAGEFDHLYGPYRAKGIVMKAPPKTYVESPTNSGAKGAGQGRAGDV